MSDLLKSRIPNFDENRFNSDPMTAYCNELLTVQNNPRSLLLVASGILELLVEHLILVHCKNAKAINKDNRSYSYAVKLLVLNEKKTISDEHFSQLDKLRKIRNDAAHKPIFNLTRKELNEIKTYDPSLHHGRSTRKEMDEFIVSNEPYHWYYLLLWDFFMVHWESLAPTFTPYAFEAIQNIAKQKAS